jgi:hypothetical protein
MMLRRRSKPDNRVHNLRLNTAINKRAIFNDTSVESLGRIELPAR